jgi:hypothetical protein
MIYIFPLVYIKKKKNKTHGKCTNFSYIFFFKKWCNLCSETLARPIFLGNSFCCGTISLCRKLQEDYVFSRILIEDYSIYMKKKPIVLCTYSRLFVMPGVYMSISNFFG